MNPNEPMIVLLWRYLLVLLFGKQSAARKLPSHITITYDKATSRQQQKPSDTTHNTWTEDIEGWGYSPGSRFDALRQKVFKRDGHKCIWCGSRVNLTVDHIKELSRGGGNELANLRTLCKNCHETRHGRAIFSRSFIVDDNYGFNRKINAKIEALINAAESDVGIAIKYSDREGLKSTRIIRPQRIYKAKNIYVNAYCELDKDIRVFRLSRMTISENEGNHRYHNDSNTYTSSPWTGDKPFDLEVGKTIYEKR